MSIYDQATKFGFLHLNQYFIINKYCRTLCASSLFCSKENKSQKKTKFDSVEFKSRIIFMEMSVGVKRGRYSEVAGWAVVGVVWREAMLVGKDGLSNNCMYVFISTALPIGDVLLYKTKTHWYPINNF